MSGAMASMSLQPAIPMPRTPARMQPSAVPRAPSLLFRSRIVAPLQSLEPFPRDLLEALGAHRGEDLLSTRIAGQAREGPRHSIQFLRQERPSRRRGGLDARA